MQPSTILLLALTLAASPGLATLVAPAAAQVTIDLRALDALPKAGSAPGRTPQPTPRPSAAVRPLAVPPQPPSPASASQPPTSASPPPVEARQPVVLPNETPPEVTMAPVPSEANAPPPAAAPPAASGAAAAAPGPADLRLTFDSGATELSAADAASIKRLTGAGAAESASFNVVAYAAGKADDPSTARRLSLSRALAVRTALMAEGVASSRIYVRALGAQSGSGPADRVDVSMLGSNAAATPAAVIPR